jgi:hypothetical protein
MKNKTTGNKHIIFWIFLLGILIFLTFNRHSKSGINNYHSEIWADKAGYYIYLPGTFIYGWQANQLPDSIDIKTGLGFRSDNNANNITTKYTYGVALLESPFFLGVHSLQSMQGNDNSGFSIPYARSIGVSGCFWLVIGLYLLSLVLRRFLSNKQSVISIIILLTGTNLLYYAIIEGGMSHVYSFFAFALFIFSLVKYHDNDDLSSRLLIGISIGLIIIIRPINILFVLINFIGLAIYSYDCSKKLFKSLFSPAVMLPICILIIPQIMYWLYAFNSPLIFSYGDENFSNLSSPPILKYIFSPHNGLLPYGILWILFALSALSFQELSFYLKAWGIISFFLITYIFSSWWNWNYGCGYGCRSLIEYSALFAMPFMIQLHRTTYKRTFVLLILFCISVNIKLILSYDQCWTASDWDWGTYSQLLLGPTK